MLPCEGRETAYLEKQNHLSPHLQSSVERTLGHTLSETRSRVHEDRVQRSMAAFKTPSKLYMALNPRFWTHSKIVLEKHCEKHDRGIKLNARASAGNAR
jgi:hypothetical protein